MDPVCLARPREVSMAQAGAAGRAEHVLLSALYLPEDFPKAFCSRSNLPFSIDFNFLYLLGFQHSHRERLWQPC